MASAFNPFSTGSPFGDDLVTPNFSHCSYDFAVHRQSFDTVQRPEVTLPRGMDTIPTYVASTQLHSSAGDTTELSRISQNHEKTNVSAIPNSVLSAAPPAI